MADSIISKKDLNKLSSIAHACIVIRKKLVLGSSTLTPINYREEMDKFFSSDSYNPVFQYNNYVIPPYDKHMSKLKQDLDSLNIPQDLKQYLEQYIDHLNILFKTKTSIGERDFAKYAKKLFKWNIQDADEVLNQLEDVVFPKLDTTKLYSAADIKKIFEEVLIDKYEIKDYTVRINNFTTHIISTGGKYISIGSGVKRYKSNVNRLIVHEIESHVLQAYNLHNSTSPLTDLAQYDEALLTVEGLAVYNEVQTQTITKKAFNNYYFRLKATNMLDKSFREIFEELSKDLSHHLAFLTTYRVKRGMKNTKEPGGFPKDASYLLGYAEINDQLKNGYNWSFFYRTKSAELTELLLKYELLTNQRILLPNFYRY